MELIIVLLCFLLILCFLKIKENFDTYNSHLHIHTNKDPNHHLNSHTHPTLPIANPNFKFEERKMICEQIDNIDTCEYYGCKWDKNKKICRNPDTVCDKIKTFSGTIKQRKGICDTLDNCKWYEATSECSSDILCPEYKRADTNCTNYTDCENTSKKCLPHCKSATIINSGEMCVPKIQTCKDLEMKDTCEAYPNIRYCKWDDYHNKCTERVRNTEYGGITFPIIKGCTDINATNYKASAAIDDGTCITPI